MPRRVIQGSSTSELLCPQCPHHFYAHFVETPDGGRPDSLVCYVEGCECRWTADMDPLTLAEIEDEEGEGA